MNFFYKLVNFSFFLLLTFTITAVKAGTNEKEYEKKLKKYFVKKGNWMSDFDKALKKAQKEKKPVFVYFTRSYAP